MVAVLTVFANHLWGWPSGGFVGVDIFFVISGFLITGNLLRSYDKTGGVSFGQFYLRRAKRIIPAATLVLALTCIASIFAFFPNRAESTRVDAVWAFFFASNWHFAAEDTDYFSANGPVSPLQHYWSLSIEEQFYFIWPALIFVIGFVAAGRKAAATHRLILSAAVMALVVAASFWWALVETDSSPTWAYFNTFARAWELGVGALLAICAGWIAPRLRHVARTPMAWGGLAIIGGSLFVVRESPGFPAPWAAFPVIGTALVIAAGIGREPKKMSLLTNPASQYIGNISYSLYLWHWPVIVILASLMDVSGYYYLAVLAFAFGGAIASYHLVETPLRTATWENARRALATRGRRDRHSLPIAAKFAVLATASLMFVGLAAYGFRPMEAAPIPPVVAAQTGDPLVDNPSDFGPAGKTLQEGILSALSSTSWPDLDPQMDAAIAGPQVSPALKACGKAGDDIGACTWGSSSAPVRVVLVGDSVAMTYAGPLKTIAEESNGRIAVRSDAAYGCTFVDATISNQDRSLVDACPRRKADAIAAIKALRPQFVIVSNTYEPRKIDGTDRNLSADEWRQSLAAIVREFSDVTTVVFLAPPPSDVDIAQCYTRGSVPSDCVSSVTENWTSKAQSEQALASEVGGFWIDSSPWFCAAEGYCPAFVGHTPTKLDAVHMTPEYGMKITPALNEALHQEGIG